MVDREGVPFITAITFANMHDSQPAARLFREAKADEPTLVEVVADSACVGLPLHEAANDNGMALRIVRRSEPRNQFVPLPQRWVIERTFAWLGRSRRLSKRYEQKAE